MLKNQGKMAASRQRPVSCRFCRARKLRCSREAPCSNCVSRGIRCDLEIRVGKPPSPTNDSESALIERIKRLENILLAQQNLDEGQHAEEALETRQSSGAESHVQQVHSAALSPEIQCLANDVAWLESIYMGQNLSVSCCYRI